MRFIVQLSGLSDCLREVNVESFRQEEAQKAGDERGAAEDQDDDPRVPLSLKQKPLCLNLMPGPGL